MKLSDSIVHQENHSQTPVDVNIQVAMHYPSTWIVRYESDDGPTIDGNGNCVPQRRVDEVEFLSVALGIEISKAFSEDVEIVSVEMNWVVFGCDDARVLQDDLNS